MEIGPTEHGALTVAQAYLLRQIQLKGSCTASEIGGIMGITSGPVTTITGRLIEQKLIVRHQNVIDHRIAEFSLTTAGELVLQEAMDRQRRKFSGLFEQLGSEKCQALFDLMTEIQTVILHGE